MRKKAVVAGRLHRKSMEVVNMDSDSSSSSYESNCLFGRLVL